MAAILQKIYNEVWEPVEQAFPIDANRVIVSPDGATQFPLIRDIARSREGLRCRKILDPVRDERPRSAARASTDLEQAGHRDGQSEVRQEYSTR